MKKLLLFLLCFILHVTTIGQTSGGRISKIDFVKEFDKQIGDVYNKRINLDQFIINLNKSISVDNQTCLKTTVYSYTIYDKFFKLNKTSGVKRHEGYCQQNIGSDLWVVYSTDTTEVITIDESTGDIVVQSTGYNSYNILSVLKIK